MAEKLWLPPLSLLLVLAASQSHARTETFRWLDPNPLPSPVVAFKLHMGSGPRDYTTAIDIGLPTPDAAGVYSFSVEIPDTETVYVALTASDILLQQSQFSNERVRNSTVASPTPTPQPTPTPTAVPMPFPVIAHWKLDEGSGSIINDSSGSGHTGQIFGAVWSSDAGSASLSFDGIDDYVDVGGVDVAGQAMTISLWFKADGFAVSDARMISKATGVNSSEHYWMLSTIDSGGIRLRFRVRAGGSTGELRATSGDLLPNVWTHAAVVYTGTSMLIYKDGVEVGSTAKTGALATDASVVVAIGNQPPGAGNRPFAGQIDELQIYNRALTRAQIAEISSAGRGVSDEVQPPVLLSAVGRQAGEDSDA